MCVCVCVCVYYRIAGNFHKFHEYPSIHESLICEILGLYSDIHGYVGLICSTYMPGTTVLCCNRLSAIAVGTEILSAVS